MNNFYLWFKANLQGYTAQDICDTAYLNNALLSNWWHGRATPSSKNLIKLCQGIHKLTNADLEQLYVTAMIALAKDLEA